VRPRRCFGGNDSAHATASWTHRAEALPFFGLAINGDETGKGTAR
jgi:hypothetical protein